MEDSFGDLEIDYESFAQLLRVFVITNDYSSDLGQMFKKTKLLRYDLNVPDVEVTAWIKSITNAGLVNIRFSEPLDLPENIIDHLDSTTLEVIIKPSET